MKEVKNTKKGFVPKHTRIKHLDGRVPRSDERPDVLAGYFEQVHWGGVETKDIKEIHKK